MLLMNRYIRNKILFKPKTKIKLVLNAERLRLNIKRLTNAPTPDLNFTSTRCKTAQNVSFQHVRLKLASTLGIFVR